MYSAMTIVELHDAIAKAIADAIGHGMREKCTVLADAVIAVVAPQLVATAERVEADLGSTVGATVGTWLPITPAYPVPLLDVIISVKMDDETQPLTYMAYRKALGDEIFYVSGTSDVQLRGAYAYRHCDEPAPLAIRGPST